MSWIASVIGGQRCMGQSASRRRTESWAERVPGPVQKSAGFHWLFPPALLQYSFTTTSAKAGGCPVVEVASALRKGILHVQPRSHSVHWHLRFRSDARDGTAW